MPVKTAKATPKDHASTHAIGGSDEVTDIGTHATRHAVGGADAISDLATHASRHGSGGADEVTGVVPEVNEASIGADNALASTEEFLYEASITVAAGMTLHIIIVELDWIQALAANTFFRLRRGGTSGDIDGTNIKTWSHLMSWNGILTLIFISTGAPTGTVLYKVTGWSDGTATVRAGSKVSILRFAE